MVQSSCSNDPWSVYPYNSETHTISSSYSCAAHIGNSLFYPVSGLIAQGCIIQQLEIRFWVDADLEEVERAIHANVP